jgi:hypothetical protein
MYSIKKKEKTKNEILDAVFYGEIDTLIGFLELCRIGVPMDKARYWVYGVAALGRNYADGLPPGTSRI